ncbi:MAG: hypothetical protein ACRD0D_14330 [Acidimicrobiales bacterium]
MPGTAGRAPSGVVTRTSGTPRSASRRRVVAGRRLAPVAVPGLVVAAAGILG